MRYWSWCVALALAAIGQAQASDQGQVSLTVYNKNLALVQDIRHLDVPNGRSRIEFKDVSASIKPETVSLTGRGLSVVEQNFDYDLLTPAKMMEKAVGKQIQIIRTNPGTGAQTTETATVLSVNSGVVLKIGNRIEVLRDDGIPTRVVFASIPENLRAKPTLSVTVDASGGGPRDATLSYLSTGMSWKADYVALFDETQAALNLQGWVTLTNNSGTAFANARTQLIAGDINVADNEQENWQRQQNRGRYQTGSAPAGSGSAADYHAYQLPERVTVAENQTKQVGFVDLKGVKARKTYEYRATGFDGSDTPIHAAVALKFSNTDTALPSGIVRVYMRDEGGEPKFVGEDEIDHTPAGSELTVKIGDAFDVTVQPTVVTSEKISKLRTLYSMSYAFHNAKSEAVTVDLRQPGLGRDGEAKLESIPSRRLDADTLGWSVPVPANGDATLTFSVEAGG
jgi:hypothetical protein